MDTSSWRLEGGLNLVRGALTRNRYPGELVGCLNIESRAEGYRRIDGFERFDGRKSPSDVLDDEVGTETAETEERRLLIGKVPGTGRMWVWRYNDATYAFRADADGATMKMHRSSATGWTVVDLGHRVAFTDGTGGDPVSGEAIANSSNVAATVVGHYLTSGTWAGGDAAGVLVLTYDGSTVFASSDVLTVEAESTRKLTISDVPTEQTIGNGTSFDFVNYNFFGRDDLERMYGVSGAGLPFEFDGTMFVQLQTGVDGYTPIKISAHQAHLFIGYKEGSVIYSGTGKPRSYDAVDGAGEIAIGDELTDMLPGYRDILFIYGRNRTNYLVGTSAVDFQLKTLSDEAGAMAGTVQLMDEPVCLDDRGFRNVTATQRFGDFSIATISEQIRPLLDRKRAGGILPVASVRIRRKSQYRIWFTDGDCIVLGYVRRGRGSRVEYTRTEFYIRPDGTPNQPELGIVNDACSVEDSDGRERVFATMRGSDFVYELDRGPSFDGHPIESYFRMCYNDFQAPHIVKRYRKLLLEVDSVFRSSFSLAADFDDDREVGVRPGRSHTVSGPASFWSEAEWGAFYWLADPVRKAEQRIKGRGRNVSLVVFSVPDSIETSYVVSGVTVYYEKRKLKR